MKGPPYMMALSPPQRNRPPWMGAPVSNAAREPEGCVPPWVNGPCQDAVVEQGGRADPWRNGPFPDEEPWGNGLPGPRGPDSEEMFGPGQNMPPCMWGLFPEERCSAGRGVPPEMGGPFPGGTCSPRGDISPHTAPFPGGTCGSTGDMSPHKRGPFPDEMCNPGGNLCPRVRGPCPEEMSKQGADLSPEKSPPCPDDMCGHKGNMPAEMDHCSGEMEAGGDMPPPRNGLNTCGPQPSCASPGESGLQEPASSGARQQQMESDRSPPGNCSSDQPASGENEEYPTSVRRVDLQKDAARILESFGLSIEDLDELCSCSDDQLKPENMPAILDKIRKRKVADRSPSLSRQETFGQDGACAPPVGSEEPVTVKPAVAKSPLLPDPPEAEKMKNCPSQSVMEDYYSVTPRAFPHACSLCKMECSFLKGWNYHINTKIHLKSCHTLRHQYRKYWNPEDSFWLRRYKDASKASCSSQPPGHSGHQSQPRPLISLSRASVSAEHQSQPRPLISLSRASVSAGHQSQPRPLISLSRASVSGEHQSQPRPLISLTWASVSAGHQSQPRPLISLSQASVSGGHQSQPRPLISLSRASVSAGHQSQPRSRTLRHERTGQPGSQPPRQPLKPTGILGTVTTGRTHRASLPPVQIEPQTGFEGLTVRMQMVAAQVVQAALASTETSGGHVSSGRAGISPQPSGSASHKAEVVQEQLGVPPSIFPQPAAASQSKEVYICGHTVVCQARDRAIESVRGSHLGLGDRLQIHWLCQEGMQWEQLVPTLEQAAAAAVGPPKAIVVQLGENDLGRQMDQSIQVAIVKTLDWCLQRFPGTTLFWSDILHRPRWVGQKPNPKVREVAAYINNKMRYILKSRRSHVIQHPRISRFRRELYKEDGFHLSDAGIDLWLEDVRSALTILL